MVLRYTADKRFQGIHALLNQCPKLTHLSLTGVQAFFLREDLILYCREAPPGLSPFAPLSVPFWQDFDPLYRVHRPSAQYVLCFFWGGS